MVSFKLSEIWHSLCLFAKTGDVEHLGDVWRIATWDGKEVAE